MVTSLAQAESQLSSKKTLQEQSTKQEVSDKALIQSSSSSNYQEFLKLSQSLMTKALPKPLDFKPNASLSAYSSSPSSVSPADSPAIFIEQEILDSMQADSVADDKDTQGQWSVSFDLSRIEADSAGLNFNTPFSNRAYPNFYDWELGSSLVSADQTSRFYVNYGNRKVPISISFDENPTDNFSRQDLNLGFEQSFDQNWAVSIAYLKTDQQLDRLGQGILEPNSLHEVNYSFDISQPNQIETLNFSPFNQNRGAGNFLFDDVSAIEIKVSRQLGQSFSLNAKASELKAQVAELGYLNPSNPNPYPLDLNKLALAGQYQVNDHWSLDASLEKESGHLLAAHSENSNNTNHFDATTLDIGVQYQSNWENVGVVIRIDLMNLLGLEENADTVNRYGLDQDGLVPFSFDTPKYIKLSGSINF